MEMMWVKLINAWRRYGWWGMAQNLAAKSLRLLGMTCHVNHLFARRLTDPIDETALPPYQMLTWADFEQHRSDDPLWFTSIKMAKLARYYRVAGNRAFGCFEEGRLVAYGWISEQYMGFSRRRLAEGDGYLWDGYTHPDYRGCGWHGHLIRIREAELQRAGKVRAVSVVANFNRASRRGFTKSGYILLERYCFGKWCGRFFSTLRYGTIE